MLRNFQPEMSRITTYGIFAFLCLVVIGVESVVDIDISNQLEDKNCIVTLQTGKIRGNCSNADYDAYTRVPYGQPPIGDLRFESPKPINKWEGIKNANESIVKCVQYANDEEFDGVEDCLYVNVYVPKRKNISESNVAKKLMVMLWIFPGAFQFGAPDNSPEVLMSVGDIIYVTLGYRTGPAGFLSTSDERIPGNFGLKDQRLAIQWVHENIDAFGGDANRILLLGDSAGGASVEYHMITNSSRAKAFASMSGSILNPWAFTTTPQIPAEKLAELLNCDFKAADNEFKKCVQSKPVQEIWQATMDMHKYRSFSVALFRPTIESVKVKDAFLTQHPIELIKAGKYRKKPYLVGLVEGEGAFMAASFLEQYANHTEIIEELNQRWEEVCPLIFFYENENPILRQLKCASLKRKYMCRQNFNFNSYKLLERMFGDEYFHNGIDKTVKLHRNAGQKVYRYIANLTSRYNIGNIMSNRLDLCFESVHTSDAFSIMPVSHTMDLPYENMEAKLPILKEFVGLFKTMVDDEPPSYKDIQLPANGKGTTPDQCLFLSYEGQKIDKCGFGKIDCKNVKSVSCNT